MNSTIATYLFDDMNYICRKVMKENLRTTKQIFIFSFVAIEKNLRTLNNKRRLIEAVIGQSNKKLNIKKANEKFLIKNLHVKL